MEGLRETMRIIKKLFLISIKNHDDEKLRSVSRVADFLQVKVSTEGDIISTNIGALINNDIGVIGGLIRHALTNLNRTALAVLQERTGNGAILSTALEEAYGKVRIPVHRIVCITEAGQTSSAIQRALEEKKEK
jgi:hypothetical protein